TKQRRPKGDGEGTYNAVFGVAGTPDGMPRSFCFSHGASQSAVRPGGIPRVDGRLSMVGFGALVGDGKGNLWAGERDRIARLVRYPLDEASGGRKPPEERRKPPDRLKSDRPKPSGGLRPPLAEDAPRLPCHVVFAPAGTTTDGSGYTAIEVGKDGKVYVGAARYGDYAWLLRFDPAASPTFMDRVVSMKQLTGERREGISTQGKIHAKIVVAGDGKVWFASKQAHEVFDTRPEYGEDPDGYPGGHLCCFDPKTGFSRSVGILKRQEGLMGGVIDDARGRLYYRSDPKGHLLAYDLKTGDVRDRGHVGSACRYMAIDKHGAVYLAGRGPFLCRYDPETDYVEDLRIKVEGEGGYSSPYVLAIGPNGKLYGVGVTHPSIMEFDIDKLQRGATEVVMRNAAPAAPPGYPVSDIHAAVFGKDGRLYYPLNTTGPVEKGGKPVQHLRLMRFDPAPLALPSPPKGGREGRARGARKAETVGVPQVVGLDEEKVKQAYARPGKFRLYVMQGAAVGADGTLFLMGISPQLHVACFPKLTAAK
ncbi:MAG TPA: hypothetical protein VFA26_25995, partial [Gemmataceae bacterium]|nr:hypothetical protein [Gemmataceae bacterium]